MKIKLNFIIACFTMLYALHAAAQEQKPLGVIFSLQEQSSIELLKREFATQYGQALNAKEIVKSMKTYLYQCEQGDGCIDYNQLQNILMRHPHVKHVGYNVAVESRLKPNDPRISEQYALDAIKAYEAWDITTGGKNANGDDVVIAILDTGFDTKHEDLKESLYTNKGEIPGDNLDNDGNGYKDDINGWNVGNNSPIFTSTLNHGSEVMGAVAAKPNNGKGVSGVLWNPKVMIIQIQLNVGSVLSAYDYILEQRKLYNITNGTKGANIVVANYSGGLENAFPKDFPAWCDIYQTMGLEGILNVVSTTNDKVNVEIVGDMPSLCTSPYLVVVNSSDATDNLDAVTGIGNISVDLSAPGDQILTTIPGDKYRKASGTSLSAPIVAGAIALLHSIDCKAIPDEYKADPADVALKIKKALLDGVDKKPSMANSTVTGGRLNILESIKEMQAQYLDCDIIVDPNTPLVIKSVSTTLNTASVLYEGFDGDQISMYVLNQLGQIIVKEEKKIDSLRRFNFDTTSWPLGPYFVRLVGTKSDVAAGFIKY
jgi:subtilisin family serine protease